jgi:predicted nucleic acid-binding protein
MYLLDTNVVSELRKVRSGKADRYVAAWSRTVSVASLFISAITVNEIELGGLLMERRDAMQGAILRSGFDDHVLPAFADRVLSVDTAVAIRSAQLHVPNPRPVRDSFIAATALVHRMTIVTRNVNDFQKTGVEIIDPWQKTFE